MQISISRQTIRSNPRLIECSQTRTSVSGTALGQMHRYALNETNTHLNKYPPNVMKRDKNLILILQYIVNACIGRLTIVIDRRLTRRMIRACWFGFVHVSVPIQTGRATFQGFTFISKNQTYWKNEFLLRNATFYSHSTEILLRTGCWDIGILFGMYATCYQILLMWHRCWSKFFVVHPFRVNKGTTFVLTKQARRRSQ